MAAAGSETASQFFNNVVQAIITPIIDLLAVAAFVVFLWGLVNFIWSAGDAEKRSTGQQHMLWGIVGFVIIFGAGAIINIINATFGFS